MLSLQKILVDWFGIGTRTLSEEEADAINGKALKYFRAHPPSAETLKQIKQFYV